MTYSKKRSGNKCNDLQEWELNVMTYSKKEEWELNVMTYSKKEEWKLNVMTYSKKRSGN